MDYKDPISFGRQPVTILAYHLLLASGFLRPSEWTGEKALHHMTSFSLALSVLRKCSSQAEVLNNIGQLTSEQKEIPSLQLTC